MILQKGGQIKGQNLYFISLKHSYDVNSALLSDNSAL